jgi:hypothetical protein
MRKLFLLAATVPTLVLAQAADTGRSAQEEYRRGYAATPMPHQDAINAGGAAGVDQLNGQAAAGAQASADAGSATARTDQAQYAADRAAYLDALVRHDHAVDRTDARYRRQQNAYADAMAVWRVQVAECKRGNRQACDLPAPDPADYY